VNIPLGHQFFLLGVPGLLLFATFFAMPYASSLTPALTAKLPLAPYLIFAGGIALGLLYKQHRIVLTLLALGAAYWSLHGHVSEQFRVDTNSQLVFGAIGFMLPIALAIIAGQQERKIFSLQGLISFSMIALQIVVSIVLIQTQPLLFSQIIFIEIIPNNALSDILQIPQLIFFIYIGCTVYVGYIFVQQQSILNSGLLFSLIASGLFLQTGLENPDAALYITLAGLLPVIAIVQNAYFIAYMDELTALPGRRALNEEMARLHGVFSIAMLDVDHFKKFNDTYGHDIGDQVLKMVGGKIRSIGGGGKPYRYGGEEFAILFPNKNTKDSFPHLSNLREEIDNARMILRNKAKETAGKQKPANKAPWQEVHVTISIGVAEHSAMLENPDEVIRGADQALYCAKEKGRNRISQFAA